MIYGEQKMHPEMNVPRIFIESFFFKFPMKFYPPFFIHAIKKPHCKVEAETASK